MAEVMLTPAVEAKEDPNTGTILVGSPLAARALKLLRKHEWSGECSICPECGACAQNEPSRLDPHIDGGGIHRGHRPDCEWAKLLEDGKHVTYG